MSNMSGLWTDFVRGTATTNVVPGRQANSDLDRDAFLRLLVTQLQHQNPLDPMDDRDFIAQMAQFSSLEQMQNLNSTMTHGQAFSMVGKMVVGTIFNEATGRFEQIGGEVSHVIMRNGEPRLIVDGREMMVTDIEEVFDIRLSAMHSTLMTSQSLALVGRYIQSVIRNSEGMAIEYIEGRVDHIRFENGRPILVVGNRDVNPGNVSAVADGRIILGRNINVSEFGTGVINSIDFLGGRAQIAGTFRDNEGNYVQRFIPLESITHLSEALRHENATVTHGNLRGEVSGIHIRNGHVYIRIEHGGDPAFTDVRWTNFRGTSTAVNNNNNAGNTTPPPGNTTPPDGPDDD